MTNAPTSAGVPAIEARHRMRIALEHARVSMGDMADLLDVSSNTVGNYLSGRTTPSTAVLRVWAMRTGVPLDWIRYGTENSPPSTPTGLPTGRRAASLLSLTARIARDRNNLAA